MTCPKCGAAENPENAIQCEKCGELLLDVFGRTSVGGGETQSPQASKTASSPVESATEVLMPQSASPSAGVSQTGSRTRELQPRTLFGNRYQILEVIGEGGMGKVYKALDKELDKIIALKIIRGEKGEDQEAIHRFKQELLLARKVTHRNVIRIHDLGEAEGVKYFTMEYVEGKSLKQVIRERGKIPAEEAVPLAKQVLGALEEAHRQGVIHRDMKPQNVMVDATGAAFVMDFGIARSQDTTGVTATGAVVGTPDYMSPEQVRGEKADPQSDLFSFGVILYEMLTGALPYQAESAVSQVVMRLTQKPRAPRQINVEIPKYLESVVLKCMDLDRAIRYRSASEVVQDLDRGTVDRSMVLKTQRAVGRHKGIVAMTAVAVIAVAVSASLLTSRAANKTAVETLPVELTTLAILPFTNATGAPEFEWMRTGIPEMLVTDIGQSRFIRPVPGRVYNVLKELGALNETLFTETTLDAVSKRAPAQSVLSGQLVEAGGKLRLDMTLRKAGAGVMLPLRVEGASDDVFGLVDRLTTGVKGLLDLTTEQLKGDRDRPIAEVSSASLEAVRSYQAGLTKLQRGAPLKAIPLLKEAADKDAEFAVALAKLGEAYFATGQSREAQAAIERAVQISERPNKTLPLAERYQIHATAALIEENTEKAVESFGELAKLYPEDPDIQMSLAGAYENLGRIPEAMAGYERVLQMAPGYGAALLGLGRTQVMGGQPAKAIVSLEKAVESGQYDQDLESLGMIHSILGVAYKETGGFDNSTKNLNRSLELRQKTGDKRGQAATYLNLASVYGNSGEHRKAIENFSRSLAINRAMGNQAQVSRVLNNMGVSYREAGRLDQALQTFRESLHIEMEREDHLNMANRLDQIADIYRLKGQYDDAIVYLDQAKSHLAKAGDKREQAINLEYSGSVRRAQGLYKEALAAFLEARPL